MRLLRSWPWIAILSLSLLIPSAEAGILDLRGGVGNTIRKDRDTSESNRFAVILLGASYRTPTLDLALDLPLRWDTKTSEFDSSVWERSGDLLRPVERLKYSAPTGKWSGGLQVLGDWTPGDGFLVRRLSGRGEIDYVLPGVRFQWEDGDFSLDAGMDRPVDPTVQALALTWKAATRITLILEGAVDPGAPLSFTGDSSGGRPRADETDRLVSDALGVRLKVVEGTVFDMSLGLHAAQINTDALGRGGEISASLDFQQSYLNRMQVRVRSVDCEGGYVPAWFDAVYPLQRWGPSGETFLQVNPLDPALPDRNMLIYDLGYELGDYLSISGGFDRFLDDSMRRARFEVNLTEANGRGLEVTLWSMADDPDIKLFSDDSAVYSRARALYNFLPHFLFDVSYEHSWAFREAEAGFKPLNSILLGVMYNISL